MFTCSVTVVNVNVDHGLTEGPDSATLSSASHTFVALLEQHLSTVYIDGVGCGGIQTRAATLAAEISVNTSVDAILIYHLQWMLRRLRGCEDEGATSQPGPRAVPLPGG